MPTKRSIIHPKYKTQYQVSKWPDYDQALAQRGNITLWLAPDVIDRWNAKPMKCRAGARLELSLRTPAATEPITLIVDSSGLAVFGEGEWAPAKHRRRGLQGWQKPHLGVDETGVIVAQGLNDANADDATNGIALVDRLTTKSPPSSATVRTTHVPATPLLTGKTRRSLSHPS